jgi:UDP-N-acetyl-D-mannosaminouronate:lipid I N-acetyl-D-mannosaminouronosyltransferase
MVCKVNDIKIYSFKSAFEILNFINGKKKILIAINALKVVTADDSMKRIVNNNIGYADGTGVVLALKWKKHRNIVKIPGCELWLKIIERYHGEKSFYLIGGEQDVIEKTVGKLKTEYPKIKISGFHNGYFTVDEKRQIINDIIEKKPDIIFVAMGSPKQEFLMAEIFPLYPALYQGLGGSFDIYVNKVNRAPKWLIDMNLEWAYRFFKQPRRIAQQFLFIIKYTFRVITGIY